MKTRELDSANVLRSHTFAPTKDDPVGPTGEFLRCAPTSFPADAEAVIYRPAKSAMTSGRAGLRCWILEFKPRSSLFIEPLMGWTGGTDPLSQVRLGFPSRAAATAYAWRQGLCLTVREPRKPPRATRTYADNFPAKPVDPILLIAWARPHLVMPNLDDALGDPSRMFHGPREVAGHPLLTARERREVSQRWSWDAHLIETAVAEGMPDAASRRGSTRCSTLWHCSTLRPPGRKPHPAPATARAA
jgi:hypothetical protein